MLALCDLCATALMDLGRIQPRSLRVIACKQAPTGGRAAGDPCTHAQGYELGASA
ncbi:MAG TPA: hypothetical protein VEA63_12010 [Opitutus sp.]|nr:hypothetical protein [Opitutus sp.]